MGNKKIENKQIPICLKIRKGEESFYILKNFYEDYQSEILGYKIILSSELKTDFLIDSNKTIQISNSFFDDLKKDNNKIYFLENELSKIFDSEGLDLERFNKYIDEAKLEGKYCLLNDKLVFLGLKDEIKNELNYIDFNDLKSSKFFFDIEYNISKDKKFNEILNNKEEENQKYIAYREEIKQIGIKIGKEKENKKKEDFKRIQNEIKSKNQELENIFINIKKTLIEERENEYEKYSLKYFHLLEKLYFLLEDFRNKKLIINKEEKTFYEEFYFKQYISEIKNKEEIINLYKDNISFEKFIKSEEFKNIEEKLKNNIENIINFLGLGENQNNIEDIIKIFEDNFKKNKIKKVDYNYFQNYKKYLLQKYQNESEEIQNFINNLYYLPKEHKNEFDKIKDIDFDDNKFKKDNKLSLYSFQKSKGQEFNYIINQEIFGKDKKLGIFNRVRKNKENSLFQVLTLDKITNSQSIFLVDQFNNENNIKLLENYNDDFENFHKDILPVFFLEGSSYYILNEKGEVIDYYFIKYDTKIGNNTKYFSGIGESDFVVFPYKGLDGFIDKMIGELNNNLKKDSGDLKSGIIKTSIKQTNFYTNKVLLQNLNKILNRIKNNLHKTLIETKHEDYLYNIKQIDHRVLLDIASKIDYKTGDNLKEISHQKIVNYKKELSYNNSNNKLLKHILQKIYKFIKHNEKLKDKSEFVLRNIKNILSELQEVDNIESFSDIEIGSQIFLNHEYFSLLKIYSDGFKYTNGLSTHIDEDNFIKSISKIFELYCFKNIKKLLEEIEFENKEKINFENSESKVIKEEGEGRKKQYTYISHEEFIKDKFSDTSKGIVIEGFLEAKFNENKLRLVLGDIYNQNNLEIQNIECKYHKKVNKILLNTDYETSSQIIKNTENEKQEILLSTKKEIYSLKENIGVSLYPQTEKGFGKYNDDNNIDFSGIFGKEFKFHNNDGNYMTPDLSIEIRDKNHNIKKTIIFDAKFSAIWDEKNQIEIPNKDRFKELQKYQKIGYLDSEGIFQPFLKSPIMIMYPGNITPDNLHTFKTINNILQQTHNMRLIPIYSNQDEKVREYIKECIKKELS